MALVTFVYNYMITLATAYLAPVEYFTLFFRSDLLVIDGHEKFTKQNIRTRCFILSANGVQPLIIPVVHHNRLQTPVKDIRIANETAWQRLHWRAIQSAYGRSPFFEFYRDDLEPFYTRSFVFLHDFNLELILKISELLNIKTQGLLNEFGAATHGTSVNMKFICDKSNPVHFLKTKPYSQVFMDRFKFTDGLSILDVVCNQGPNASGYVKMHME